MIIFNPTAGQASSLMQELEAAAQVWQDHGWEVDLQPTAAAGEATRLARRAADNGYHIVAAAGGDGTINEVVNGLAGSTTALAPLPFGTMNVWARELGLPLNPRAAAEALLTWQVRTIDLGRVCGRYFLLMAGIGFDAAVTAGVLPHVKRRLGAFAYVLTGIDHLLRIRGTRAWLVLDGKRVKGRVLLIVAGNSQLYGGLIKITHRATIDDGLLDICVIKGNGIGSLLFHLISIFRRRYSSDPEIEYYRARKVNITTRTALPVQVDGDTICETPVTVEVVPRALHALMPVHLPDDLVRIPTPMPIPNLSLKRLIQWMIGQK